MFFHHITNFQTMNEPGKFLLYTAPDGGVKIDVIVKDESVWLTQKVMAELFDVKVPAISKHLANIYNEGELSETTTVSKMETVVKRGFRGEVNPTLTTGPLEKKFSRGAAQNSLIIRYQNLQNSV